MQGVSLEPKQEIIKQKRRENENRREEDSQRDKKGA